MVVWTEMKNEKKINDLRQKDMRREDMFMSMITKNKIILT